MDFKFTAEEETFRQEVKGWLKANIPTRWFELATGFWQEWAIPLSQFTSGGVNLGSIKRMMVGVGDRSSSKVGGAGKLYIDDIRLEP